MKKWYNNGTKNLVLNDNDTIPVGYIPGKLIFSKEHNHKISEKRKGKIYINNGILSKCVTLDEYNEKYNDGTWIRGRILSAKGLENISTSKKEFFKNNPNWKPDNMWEKNHIPWNKNIPMSDSTKRKLSNTKRGTYLNDEQKYLKYEHEKLTRINNSGDLKTSYNLATIKRNATREENKLNDELYLEKIKEKAKNTSRKKYGYDSPMLDPTIQEKRKKTCLKKYGFASPMQNPEIVHKVYESKKRNNSFINSKSEIKLYNYLLTKFSKDDVYRQYTDNRYANKKGYCFRCDFYIKSIDTFIELNEFWTHGPHAFSGSNEDLKILNIWKEKSINSKLYKQAISTWTVSDVFKKQIAIDNNLNMIILYKMEDIYDYIK